MGVVLEDPPSAALLCLAALLAARALLTLFRAALARSRKSRVLALAADAGAGGDKRWGRPRRQKKFERLLGAMAAPERWIAAARAWTLLIDILAGGVIAGGVVPRVRAMAADALSAWTAPAAAPPAPGVIAWAVTAVAAVLPALVYAALCHLIGQVLPRGLGRRFPETAAAALFPDVRLLAIPTYPLYRLEILVNALLGRLVPARRRRPSQDDLRELRIALMEGEKSGVVESEEREMVEGVFHLGDRPVGAFMTHRSELAWLELDADEREVRAAVEEAAGEGAGQRCFPVAQGGLDEAVGAARVEDILRALLDGAWAGLGAVTRPARFVPETMSALRAFEAFKEAGADYLFVTDEYGGFAGMVTARDLMEEIVGQLSASAAGQAGIRRRDDGTWLADGAVSLDDAAKALSLAELGSGHADYHTLAGFILDLAGEIPREGASFDHDGFRFTIAAMEGNRIDKVLVERAGGGA